MHTHTERLAIVVVVVTVVVANSAAATKLPVLNAPELILINALLPIHSALSRRHSRLVVVAIVAVAIVAVANSADAAQLPILTTTNHLAGTKLNATTTTLMPSARPALGGCCRGRGRGRNRRHRRRRFLGVRR
jgi:uncharacterized membrane protein YoaK (UPF0700 family)